jgi:cardiolipin synthase
MIAREVFMLIVGQYAIRHGVTLKINWPGRWAVWPVMSAIFFGLCGLKTLGTILLAIGLVLTLIATAMYVRDGLDELRTRSTST